MECRAAADLIAAFAEQGLRACVGGGWAVDALLGSQSRPHADLDLAIDATQLDEVISLMSSWGYRRAVDWLPVRVEWAHPNGSRVDLHPLHFAADGSAVQAGLGGTEFHYPADCFTRGHIDGRACECLTARQQLVFREGYRWRPVDHHDVPRLRALLSSSLGPASGQGAS